MGLQSNYSKKASDIHKHRSSVSSSSSSSSNSPPTVHALLSSASHSDPKKKRNRKAVSCENCRKKKVKCDRSSPCSSCRVRGEVCEWINAVPNRLSEDDDALAEAGRLRNLIEVLGDRLGMSKREIESFCEVKDGDHQIFGSSSSSSRRPSVVSSHGPCGDDHDPAFGGSPFDIGSYSSGGVQWDSSFPIQHTTSAPAMIYHSPSNSSAGSFTSPYQDPLSTFSPPSSVSTSDTSLPSPTISDNESFFSAPLFNTANSSSPPGTSLSPLSLPRSATLEISSLPPQHIFSVMPNPSSAHPHQSQQSQYLSQSQNPVGIDFSELLSLPMGDISSSSGKDFGHGDVRRQGVNYGCNPSAVDMSGFKMNGDWLIG